MADTGKIVNLRLARKARRRAADETTAAQNRAKFGRTGAEKREEADRAARLDAIVSGARRERGEEQS